MGTFGDLAIVNHLKEMYKQNNRIIELLEQISNQLEKE